MRIYITTTIFLFISGYSFSQEVAKKIRITEAKLRQIELQKDSLQDIMEKLRLEKLRHDLESFGLPELEEGEEVIRHTAMYLVYSEPHEQAKWVAHIITPGIISGKVGRTNDFRPDPLVKTATAVEQDYFLKELQPNGKYKYDGFGYDRGHLAPSADFRWSEKALSESYFYSNMSPQLAAFNRGIWAELEIWLRDYIVDNNNTQLYVVTGGVLTGDLDVVERSVNQLKIPKYYYKVALDLNNRRAIGFIMPHQTGYNEIETYAVSVDSVENFTGINFFHKLDDPLEEKLASSFNITDWQAKEEEKGDKKPLTLEEMPEGAYNTVQSRLYINANKKIKVCGTVVSTYRSSKGHIYINLDKKYPNSLFSVTIWKNNVKNFSYQPGQFLLNKKICVQGEIDEYQGTPSMYIKHERLVEVIE